MDAPLKAFLACSALALAAAPVAGADHAYNAVYQADDVFSGCHVTLDGAWVTGGGNAQTWVFTVATTSLAGLCWLGPDGAVCTGFGSVEVGFEGACVPGWYFKVSGTGHAHACCDPTSLDIHEGIVVEFISGVTGWYYLGAGGVVAYA